MKISDDDFYGIQDGVEWAFSYDSQNGWAVDEDNECVTASTTLVSADDLRFAIDMIPSLPNPNAHDFVRRALEAFCTDIACEMEQGRYEDDEEFRTTDFSALSDEDLAVVAKKADRLEWIGAELKNPGDLTVGFAVEQDREYLVFRLFIGEERTMTAPLAVKTGMDRKGIGAEAMKKIGDLLCSAPEGKPASAPTM